MTASHAGRPLSTRFLERLRRESFNPGPLGILINPGYIIRRGLWREIRDLAPTLKGRILDVGCGSRPYESLFSGAQEYIGLDVHVSGHDHQRSNIDVYYDGQTIPFDDAQFDGIVSFEVFEHVFNLNRVLDEIHRVLKPGGKLLVTIPFLWPEHEQPYDFGRYTSFGIRDILKRKGFEVEKVIKSGHFISALWQAFINYLHVNFCPRNILGRALFQFVVIFPTTLIGLLMSALMPRRYEGYSNLVVLASRQPALQDIEAKK